MGKKDIYICVCVLLLSIMIINTLIYNIKKISVVYETKSIFAVWVGAAMIVINYLE